MGWFKRIKEGITTSTNEKKETPEGLWYKCPKCKTSWSADYTDYSWMREDDLIICSCGSIMCEVNDLKDN